jgi:predicted transcriptional regulator
LGALKQLEDNMNIQTVASNLRVTIAGKVEYLATLNRELTNGYLDEHDFIVSNTTADFLKINIDELKRILGDVEQCIEETV